MPNIKYTDNYRESCRRDGRSPDKNFISWMDKIESIVHKELNLYLLDLPDENYAIMFKEKEEYPPSSVAEMIINQQKKELNEIFATIMLSRFGNFS
jgi:hypothetical protein